LPSGPSLMSSCMGHGACSSATAALLTLTCAPAATTDRSARANPTMAAPQAAVRICHLLREPTRSLPWSNHHHHRKLITSDLKCATFWALRSDHARSAARDSTPPWGSVRGISPAAVYARSANGRGEHRPRRCSSGPNHLPPRVNPAQGAAHRVIRRACNSPTAAARNDAQEIRPVAGTAASAPKRRYQHLVRQTTPANRQWIYMATSAPTPLTSRPPIRHGNCTPKAPPICTLEFPSFL
jgi:hypothetical protein